MSISIISRIRDTPTADGGYYFVDSRITDERFPTAEWPSLDGAQLNIFEAPCQWILDELWVQDRRAATVAELLFYGIKNPGVVWRYHIWGLGQVLDLPSQKAAVMIWPAEAGRAAELRGLAGGVRGGERVLTFPL